MNFKYKRLSSFIALSIGLAASVLIIIGISKPNNAMAISLINKSLVEAGNITSMKMTLNVRSCPKEPFSYIDKKAEMMPYKIISATQKPICWKIEKEERIAMFDGANTYMWIPAFKTGTQGGASAGFIDWFEVLIQPENTMREELKLAKNKYTTSSIKETDSETHLTITTKMPTQDEARNPGLNHFIDMTNSRREYVFDKTTNLIKSLKIYATEGDTETLILETTGIEYNGLIDRSALIVVPDGYSWSNLSETLDSKTFTDISPEKATQLIFEALRDQKAESIKVVFDNNIETARQFAAHCKGIEIIHIGEAFESQLDPVKKYRKFVPYEIKFPNGKIKKQNLSLRNDNPNRVWTFDGGL